MARYQVDTAQLRDLATTLAAGVDASMRVVEHPGVVRGRAQDGGDPGLRDAAEDFAARWEHGLRVMAADCQRLVDVIRLLADNYDQAEAGAVALAAAGAARPGWAR